MGVSKVGFALIVLGFFSAIMSIFYGKVVKHIHRVVMATLAMVINLFFFLFLQFYPLRPSYPLIFLFAIFWGLADGVWNTLTASMITTDSETSGEGQSWGDQMQCSCKNLSGLGWYGKGYTSVEAVALLSKMNEWVRVVRLKLYQPITSHCWSPVCPLSSGFTVLHHCFLV